MRKPLLALIIVKAASFEKRAVDPLDVNAPILHRVGRVGDLDQLAGGDVGISKVTWFDKSHWLAFIYL